MAKWRYVVTIVFLLYFALLIHSSISIFLLIAAAGTAYGYYLQHIKPWRDYENLIKKKSEIEFHNGKIRECEVKLERCRASGDQDGVYYYSAAMRSWRRNNGMDDMLDYIFYEPAEAQKGTEAHRLAVADRIQILSGVIRYAQRTGDDLLPVKIKGLENLLQNLRDQDRVHFDEQRQLEVVFLEKARLEQQAETTQRKANKDIEGIFEDLKGFARDLRSDNPELSDALKVIDAALARANKMKISDPDTQQELIDIALFIKKRMEKEEIDDDLIMKSISRIIS